MSLSDVGTAVGLGGQAAGLLGPLFGALQGSNNQDWLRGGLATVLANLNNASQYGQQGFGNLAPGIAQGAGTNAAMGNNFLWGDQNNQGMFPYANAANTSYQQAIPGLFNSNSQLQNNPLMAAIAQLAQGNQTNQGLAGQVFSSGGWTPQYQQGFDALGNAINSGGRNIPGNQNTGDIANALLNKVGNIGPTGFMSGFGQGLLENIAPQVVGAGQSGTNANYLNVPGLTQTGAQGETAALQGIQGQGANSLNSAIANKGLQLLSGNPLMSLQQAIGLARNQAGVTNAQQAEQLRARALARGGGPGAVVGSGNQNQALSDYATQAGFNTDKSVNDAIQNQQGLQLQQYSLGPGLAQGGGQLQNQALGTYANLLPNIESIAAQRYGTGGNLLSGVMGQGGQLTNQGGNLQNQFLNTCGNLAGLTQQGFLGSLNSLNSMMGNQNQYALGAGNLFGNLGNLAAGQYGAAGNLGLNTASGMTGALGSSLGNYNSLLGQLTGATQNIGYNPLLGLTGQYGDIMRTGISGQPGIFGGSASSTTQSPWSALAALQAKG